MKSILKVVNKKLLVIIFPEIKADFFNKLIFYLNFNQLNIFALVNNSLVKDLYFNTLKKNMHKIVHYLKIIPKKLFHYFLSILSLSNLSYS